MKGGKGQTPPLLRFEIKFKELSDKKDRQILSAKARVGELVEATVGELFDPTSILDPVT